MALMLRLVPTRLRGNADSAWVLTPEVPTQAHEIDVWCPYLALFGAWNAPYLLGNLRIGITLDVFLLIAGSLFVTSVSGFNEKILA